MKKTIIPAVLAMMLLVISASGAFASEQDSWAYPSSIVSFMFRLGIACEAAGIEISSDPAVVMEKDTGYVFVSVGELSLVAMFDPSTQQLTGLAFPLASDCYDEQRIILAALCEEVSVTTSGMMTKELFLQLGEIVLTQAVAGMLEANTGFAIGAYTFTVALQENGSGQLNMVIRANSDFANDEEDADILYLDSDSVNMVYPGQLLCVRLAENQTTPYRWQFAVTDAALIEYASDAYKMDANPQDADGVGGSHSFYFRAIGVGSCAIQMFLSHEGEGIDESIQTATYTIMVEDPPNPAETQTNGFAYVGLWHSSPSLGSGFSERLLLSADQTFLWAASQMDGLERTRFRSGTWTVGNGCLNLTTEEEICLEGGTEVPAYGSFSTDTVIEGADVVLCTLTEPAAKEYELSPVTTDQEVLDKRTLTINEVQYWQLAHPTDLETLHSDYAALRQQAR